MEKFSAYRDAGTGIQPFLTPVPPAGGEFLAQATIPLRYPLAVVRTMLVLVISLLYLVTVQGACLLLLPLPPLYDFITHILTYALGRTALFILGLFWIPVDYTTRKRGKNVKDAIAWNPKAGDLIVSNWASWIEIVWLAIRFNPIFVVPIPEKDVSFSNASGGSPIAYRPGRRTGTGSANINQVSRTQTQRIPIAGFKKASLWEMIMSTGYAPSPRGSETVHSLEEIRKSSRRPLVVFPECTSSNARGLLRFADVFKKDVPIKGYNVHVLCVRYDPPTAMTPTPSHSIPSGILNPLPHVFTLATSLSPVAISVRLLPLAESPSSQLFVASEIVSGDPDEDQLAESCAVLIAQIGKLKRTGKGWEDKTSLLELYFGRKK
ncbi:hypothetical protein CC1G_00220 [Coprinopsis cinerea okayama7|uniref:Phospholipid/glycerol acyltransferase domain-containing protein n=1 Tax=Coprinopsis cinerea (strain Okayama-7 / 130 / ATCC MYA-4618 / FGSC 9003) TaxID=240176 RepID=A8NX70_COPC7|nr:hypothetical protein CC1G_00220 [Coprinopsis cinerea okayama7\|eukprot:XP_001837084.1 hypothetical protein CC1G_00220 [Coprinopsis cinerea okayama7\